MVPRPLGRRERGADAAEVVQHLRTTGRAVVIAGLVRRRTGAVARRARPERRIDRVGQNIWANFKRLMGIFSQTFGTLENCPL